MPPTRPGRSDPERRGGTGLGLAAVYGISRQLDGEAVVDTTLGEGTTVRLLLPAVDPDVLPPG